MAENIPAMMGSTEAYSGRLKEMIDEIRRALTDEVKLNRMVEGEEFSDHQIFIAMRDAVDMVNMIPPLTSFDMNLFLQKLRPMLKTGAIAGLLRITLAGEARNAIDYSDGGISINSSRRYQLVRDILNYYDGRFNEMTTLFKRAWNVSNGFGRGLASDYAFLTPETGSGGL